MSEVPVYLFTGFLEAGKTTFIRDTLADPRFNQGERILLLCCEEGEVTYDTRADYMKKVAVEVIGDSEQMKNSRLRALEKTYHPEMVMVEYNGMWTLDTFYGAMPKGWVIAQNFLFVHAPTFLSYNANMRQLVSDKVFGCELVVFNRFTPQLDKMAFHKVIRALSRRADIAYEYTDGHVEYDDTEDPLPFDVNAPVVEVEDRDYALWYRDLSEDMEKYDGKTVSFKAQAARDKGFPEGCFVLGRHVMTCCVQDIQFAGLAATSLNGALPQARQWLRVRARIAVRYHKMYDRKGPVLTVLSMDEAPPPDPVVATFY